MISLGDFQLLDLLRQREEPHPPKRQQIHMLCAPWPWPWLILEMGVPWICPMDIEPSRNPKMPPRRRAPRLPASMGGEMVALLCTTPVDSHLVDTMEARGLAWPACPEDWRGAVVGVARLAGEERARSGFPAPASARWWPSGHPLAWCLEEVVPIDPLRVDAPGSRLSLFAAEYLGELRQRYQLGKWGCYRHPRLPLPG